MERRVNEIVNRLNKTKEERTIDFEAEKAARLAMEKRKRREEAERRKAEEIRLRKEREAEAELKSYDRVFRDADMNSNRPSGPIDPRKYEEDFF